MKAKIVLLLLLALVFYCPAEVKAYKVVEMAWINEDGTLTKQHNTQGGCTTATPSLSTSGTPMYFGGLVSAGPVYRGYRAYVEYDVSIIPLGSTIHDVRFKYEGVSSTGDNTSDEEINPITNQPSTASVSTLWTDIGDGTAYVDPWSFSATQNAYLDLGDAAVTDLQSNLDSGYLWFAIGFQSPTDECPAAGTKNSAIVTTEGLIGSMHPILYVEYTEPSWISGKGGGATGTERPALSIDKFIGDLFSSDWSASSLSTKLFLVAPFLVAGYLLTSEKGGSVEKRRRSIERQKRRSVKQQEKRRRNLEKKY